MDSKEIIDKVLEVIGNYEIEKGEKPETVLIGKIYLDILRDEYKKITFNLQSVPFMICGIRYEEDRRNKINIDVY